MDDFSLYLQTWIQSRGSISSLSRISKASKWDSVREKFHPNKDTPASDAIYRSVGVLRESNESQQSEQQRFDKLDLS